MQEEPDRKESESPVRPVSSAAGPRRVAVGMSGGLDSSVVAALCVDQGWEVLGLTLHMFKEGSRCCSIEDVNRARRVCEYLGIRHYVINAMEQFEELIIRRFVDEYASGRTPSPCILCNEHIKFGTLHQRALQFGCTHIATGHYARLEAREDGVHLLRALDRRKDQSYFLHRLTQEQLRRSLFPLEARTKTEAAAYARERGLPIEKSLTVESQDLCFVPDDGHPAFVEQRRPELRRLGEIRDLEGRVLGKHGGYHRYTVGQRRGLGVAATTPLYVHHLEPGANRVVLAEREEVMSTTCCVEDVHWIVGPPSDRAFASTARVRYRHEAAACEVVLREDRRLRLTFKEPQFAVTPGQAAVLYDGDEVLGGGWIAAAERWDV